MKITHDALSKYRFFYFSLHEFNLPIQVLLHFQSLPLLQSFILRIVLMVLAILLYSNHPVAQTHLKLLNFVLLLAVFKSFSLLRNSGHIHKYYTLSRGLCIFVFEQHTVSFYQSEHIIDYLSQFQESVRNYNFPSCGEYWDHQLHFLWVE